MGVVSENVEAPSAQRLGLSPLQREHAASATPLLPTAPGGPGSPGSPGKARSRTSPRVRAARPFPHAAAAKTGPAIGARRESIFRHSLLAADVTALALALALAVDVSPGLSLGLGSLLAVPMLAAGAKLLGLYDRDEALIRKTTLDEAPRLFQLATLTTLAVWFADRQVIDGPLRRSGALLLWGSLTALLTAVRALARSLALRRAPVERCLFLGDIESERRIRAKLAEGDRSKAQIVAHLQLQEAGPWSTSAFSAERLAEIRELAQKLDVHRAILAPDGSEDAEMLDLVCALGAVGIRVSVLPRLLEVMGSAVEFEDLQGEQILGLRRFELTRSTMLVKRAFDLVCSSLALLLAAPAMLLAAVAIKLDSRGPVLFRQLRVGHDGRHFSIFKFRTMVCDADSLRASLADRNEAQDGLFKIADDPRITRAGRVLRKTYLDELPQLINVLRGEMSLVGPRPLVVEEDVRLEGRLRRRLQLLPGITGNWQILGPARVPLRQMAMIDYLYAGNWSLWTDIKVLLRTAHHVLARRGL
jgi:exopolysaccharide biosynthesis polyprenyl glycosylphosphotransferase